MEARIRKTLQSTQTLTVTPLPANYLKQKSVLQRCLSQTTTRFTSNYNTFKNTFALNNPTIRPTVFTMLCFAIQSKHSQIKISYKTLNLPSLLIL